MKKNTLYTANKWNRNLFNLGGYSPTGSQFYDFGAYTQPAAIAGNAGLTGYQGVNVPKTISIEGLQGGAGTGWTKGLNTGNSFMKNNAGTINTVAGTASPFLTKMIGGGYSTGGVGEGVAQVGQAVGSALAATGIGGIAAPIVTLGAGILGGAINRGWGTKKNQKNINAIENNTATANMVGDAFAGASDTEGFLSAANNMTNSMGFGNKDLVKGGWFSKGKAKREAQKYLNKERAALAMQNHSMVTGAQRVDNILDDNVMSNFAAWGGPLGGVPMTGALGIMQTDKYIDAINNRSNAIAKSNIITQTKPSFSPMGNAFADGGGIHIKPSHRGLFTEKAHRAGMGVQEYASHVLANKDGGFVNTFMQDPIQAAMQYMQQQDALEAQREAQEAALAQQAEYDALQQRLANAETQNEGLQALLNSQGLSIQALQDAQMAGGYAAAPTEAEIEAAEAAETANEVVNTAVSKNKNWNYIRRKLKESGKFNNTQIEGIRLNLQRESNFNPNAVGDGGKAFGLGQWHPDRQPKDRSFDGQINHLINTLSAYDGNKHWIGRNNYEGFMNARTPEEAHYYIAKGWERPADRILAGVKSASDRSLRKHAFGGELGTNGTDFTTGLLEINTGNSHENNPHEGVQLGVDANGIPNLVEEGETVYNDYVFSNRMDVPAFMRRELGLGGAIKKDITFAQASKKLSEASKERPNSPIDQAGLDAALGKLAQVQEAERMKMQAEEQNMEMEAYLNSPMNAFGGNLFAGGGAMKYLQNKNVGNKKQIANAMDAYINKYMKGSKATDSVKYGQAYDAIMKGMGNFRTPTHLRDEKASRKHYDELVGLGMDKRVAFGLAFPTVQKTVDPYSPKGYDVQKYNQANSRRESLYNELIRGSKTSNSAGSTTPNISQSKEGSTLYTAANGRKYRTQQAADIATKKYNDAIAARNVQAARNQRNAAASAAPVRRGMSAYTDRRQAPAVNDNAGDIVAHKYDWYRNGSDGLTENPWGFTVGDNGLIDTNNGYTQEYRDLVNSLGANDIRRWAAEHPNDPSLQSFIARGNNLDTLTDEQWRAGATDGKYGFMHHVASQIGQQAEQPAETNAGREYHLAEGDDEYLPDWSHLGAEVRRRTLPNGDVEIYHAPGNGAATMSSEELGLGAAAQDATRKVPTDDYTPYPTWMRYAPAVGSGIMTLTDLSGLTNKHDYTYADKLEATANRAGYAPSIRYKPIGDYLRYQHLDRMYYANQMQANARATDRALMNSSGANTGAAAAGLLANSYNSQIGLGNLYRQAEEYNDAKRQQVADFNRRTDMFNSQMNLEAAMANARYRQQAQQAQMSGLSQAAAMRDAIDQRIGAARSANITNLLNNIGMIGRENFAFNQINSDRSRRNALKRNGVSYDKIAKAETAAFGGNLNKKKQGRRSK